MVKFIIKVVLGQIVIGVGGIKIYAILAYESKDVIGNELVTVAIRYVNCLSGVIPESTIGTVKVDDTGSENLFKTLVCVLYCVELNME